MMLPARKHRWIHLKFAGLASLALAGALALSAKEKKADPAQTARPVFAPRGGVFTSNVTLRLTAGTPANVIRYTLDGSEPDEASPAYTEPVALTNSTLVRARAFAPGQPPGQAVAEVFTLLDDDLRDFTSNLPLVIINTFGTNLVHERKIETGLQLIDPGTGRARLSTPPNFSGPALLNIRGRASLRYPKSSFTVRVTNGEGEGEAVSLLGLPAESDWVLYAQIGRAHV